MAEQKIVAVIPALNEENTISKVVSGVKQYVNEIILVDDASTDRTAFIAQQEGAIILSHEKRQGYEKSIDHGFALAASNGATVVLTFDGDGQHKPEDIPMLINPILNNEADVVVGRRPYYARISEYLFALVAKIKAKVDDPLCGLKAYHIKVYNDVGYFDRTSLVGSELMFNAKKKGYRIIQKDIALSRRDDSPRFGKRFQANWKILKAIVKTIC